jgi:TonB-linked SusC/RagA family outer membrane protein
VLADSSRRIRSLWLIFLGILIFAIPLNAQNLTVTGRVIDPSGIPMPGVTVLINSTSPVGTTTSTDGNYSLKNVPPDAVISFSFIGYKTVHVPVKGTAVINQQMQEDITAIDEVIINAGYYSVKDRERTGSIVKVTAREIANQPVINPLEALQGRVTGVEITQTTGTPGGGFELKIRGRNSIAAGNESLYIIDGVPYDIGSLSNRNVSLTILPGGMINPLNTLDPSAIESIEILKDADATAIYGSRGANGVVLITTKKGSSGKTSLNIEASTSAITVTCLPKLLNTEQYIQMRQEAFANDGLTEYPETEYDVNGTWDMTRYTDWQDLLIGGTARNNSVKASISGGTGLTRFNAGGSFMNETTVFPTDFNYNKATAFMTISHNSNDNRFNIQITTNYGTDRNYLPNTDLTSISRTLPPNAPELYSEDGSLNWENSTWTNPLANLESKYKNLTHNLIANTALSYNVMNWLEIRTNMGYNRSYLTEIQTRPHTMYSPAWGLTSTSSNTMKNNSIRDSWIVEPQLNASLSTGAGTFNMTVGSTFQEQDKEQYSLFASGFTNNYFINTLSAATTQSIQSEERTQYRYQAVYARINYSLQEKYFVNLTGRRDGSTRFGPDRRYANFGAVGVAWIFSKESFQDGIPWLSFGKVRASLGTSGNDRIGDYQYLDTYRLTTLNYNGYLGLSPARLLNPLFAWERNCKAEAALETSLFDEKVNIEIAYYNNRSDNQLIGTPLPGTTGFSSISANLKALVENSGWEGSLRITGVERENFKWHPTLNITIPRNRLVRFPGLEGSTYASQYEIGYPLSIYKLYELKGVNPETGVFEFKDFNSDGLITSADDRKFIADLSPKFFGNISNSLRYRNWNLDILFQFMKKQGLNEYYNTEPPGTMFNQPVGVLDRWQAQGDHASMQAFTSGWNGSAYEAYYRFAVSDAVISDASFIRLKSFSLSYKLPFKESKSGSWILYVQGQNLLTLTKFKNGDPEQLTSFLPPVRRVSVGIKIGL